MGNASELPVIPLASQEAWEVWLEEHHATSDGLWLKIAKKGFGIETVFYAEASTRPSATVGSTARRIASTTSSAATVRAAQGQDQVV